MHPTDTLMRDLLVLVFLATCRFKVNAGSNNLLDVRQMKSLMDPGVSVKMVFTDIKMVNA